MAESSTTEAPGTDETGAETTTQGPITNLEELTASFVEKVEENEESREESEAEGAETSEADAETEQEDVLLQSTEESDEESEEEVEEEEEEAEEAEAEPPKAVGKLLKQVNKLTARAKSAEENAEALKAEVDALKANPSAAEPQKPALEEVNTFEELESLRKEAIAAKRWSLQHIGKDYVEVDGKEYSDDDIRGILTQAEDYLTEKIPERGQHLQSQAQWAKDTQATHPWIEKSEGFEDRKEIFDQIKGQYSQILGSLPNADFVAATLARGVEAIKADQSKASKPAKKRRAKPPPSEIGDSSPPVQTAATRQTVEKAKILERKTLSENDLAAFLAD